MKKLMLMVFVSIGANTAELTIPNTFVANTPAVAAQVNANFSAVETSVDDNDARIDTLIALVNQLQADVISQQNTIIQLQGDLTAVENNTVLELDGLLYHTMVDGYDTAVFTGVNLRLNSGSGSTSGVVNGLGNLIIGYHEPWTYALMFCSDPQYTDSVSCTDNLNTWDNNVRTGSHNLIMGRSHSYTGYGGIISGFINVSNGNYTTVIGQENIVSGQLSSVLGGLKNQATAPHSSVSGGSGNRATGNFSSISGGINRTAAGIYDWVAGSLFEDF